MDELEKQQLTIFATWLADNHPLDYRSLQQNQLRDNRLKKLARKFYEAVIQSKDALTTENSGENLVPEEIW